MSKLPPHEWIIISLLIVTISLLTVVVLGRKDVMPPLQAMTELSSDVIQVIVKGAVANAGSFELKKGVKLKDLLALAQPLADADLSRIKPNAKLRDGQTIKIPALEWIQVHIVGAIEEEIQSIRVLKGTKVQDLIEKIQFAPDADLNALKKKRLLKDEETIAVPAKKIKAKAKVVKKGSK